MKSKKLRFGAVCSVFALGLTTAAFGQATFDKLNAVAGTLSGPTVWSLDTPLTSTGNYSIDFGFSGASTWILVTNVAFINTAAASNEMTFALWVKKYDIAQGSTFWANSTSAAGTRGWQAHTPWDNNNVYFDTMGCCDADITRINAGIDTFAGYTGDNSWWTNWHHFVFSKKGDTKQIWIDGQLFLEGLGTVALAPDFTSLYIGAANASGSLHGLIDDFAVYGTALTEADINKLFTGTAPDQLGAPAKLLAYWDFNDFPGEGQFTSVNPAADTISAAPNLIEIVHVDGATPWTANNITLKVDDATVTPLFAKSGSEATVSYVPTPPFEAQSTHKVVLTYPGAGATPGTLEWEFTVGPYTKDVLNSRIGVFLGTSMYSGDAAGHTGQAGDRAANFGNGAGPVHVLDATFLNALSANNEMAFGFWLKKPGIENGSAFWANSPSSNNGQRGFQAHVPWGDSNIYFDTAGCCDAGVTRINGNIDTFAGYTGDVSWWTNWHYFVFQKKQDAKEVWIDGQVFLQDVGTAPLPIDFTELFIGATFLGQNHMSGLIDDFAVFGTALSEATIGQLYGGTSPTALPASDKLAAFWSFNELPPEGILASIIPAPNATTGRPDLIQVVHWAGPTAMDNGSVQMTLNGGPVTPNVQTAGKVTTISLPLAPVLPPGSTNRVTLSFKDTASPPAQHEYAWKYTVANYVSLPVAQRSPLGSEDTSKPGFNVKTVQLDARANPDATLSTQANNNEWAEGALAGLVGDNVADLSAFTGGVYAEPATINYAHTEGQANGNFTPDRQHPGIPGTTFITDNYSSEFVTYIPFASAGYYTMGVNSDDNFRVSIGEHVARQYLEILAPSGIAGGMAAVATATGLNGNFGGPFPTTLIVADAMVLGESCPADPALPDLTGKIVVIPRGTCTFVEKARNAQSKGALAVVIANNQANETAFPIVMGGDGTDITIPVMMVDYDDGQKLINNPTGLRLSIGKDTNLQVGEFNGNGRGAADTLFSFYVPQAGVYPFRCFYLQGGGGANVEWFSVGNDGTRLLVNDTAAGALKAYRARTFVPAPTLTVTMQGSNLVITFTGTLQSADEAGGPYADMQGSSPQTVPTTGTKKFFRSRN